MQSAYSGNDEALKKIPIPNDTFEVNIGRVGYVQYNGSEAFKYWNGGLIDKTWYCDYSITSFSWLKSKTEIQKSEVSKRDVVYLGTSNFFNGYEYQGSYNIKKNQITYNGRYFIKDTDPKTKYITQKPYNFTFTGIKIN